MTNKEIFHKNFRKLLEYSGKSQNAVADAIGEKRSLVSGKINEMGSSPVRPIIRK